MRFTHVHASNWRNFKSIDFPVGDRLFVVGPNASGKSNLLDIFRFLGDIAKPAGGLASAIDTRGGLKRTRCLFARNHERGRLIIDVDLVDDNAVSWRYRLAIKGEPTGKHRPVVVEEIVERDGVTLLDRPDADDAMDSERLTQTHLEQISANREFRNIADYFSKVRYFHIVPQAVRNPGRLDLPPEFGGDFIAAINATPKPTRIAWLRKMQSALQAAVPQFESLDIEIDTSGRPHLVAGYRNWRMAPAQQTEEDFSDGTLRLIGLLWMIVSAPANGGVLLLEEPELSLSSAVVRMLPTVLARVQRDRGLQLILSTHASDMLDDEGVAPEEVLILSVTEDGTKVELLSNVEQVQGELTAGLSTSEIVDALIDPGDLGPLVDAGRRN